MRSTFSSDVDVRPDDLRFSSAYLRVVKLASNRFVFRTHGRNYATLYSPTHPRHHTDRYPPSAAVQSVLRMHMEYAQKDECVRN